MPTWANPADAPNGTSRSAIWYAQLPKLPLPPTTVFASEHALAEMNLLREPVSAAAHTACEHVRTVELSEILSRSGAGTVCGEDDTSQSCVEVEFVTVNLDVRTMVSPMFCQTC